METGLLQTTEIYFTFPASTLFHLYEVYTSYELTMSSATCQSINASSTLSNLHPLQKADPQT